MNSMPETKLRKRIAVIGGGAAGFFAAIGAAAASRSARVEIFEATRQLLYKVGISGGGRCNVTHNCFDPEELVRGYPRGFKELRGLFRKFQARDTVEWFERHGVKLKAEADGRMFPITDDSETIINCLVDTARKAGVQILPSSRIKTIDKIGVSFTLGFKDKPDEKFDRVVLCTGGSPPGYELARALGHTIIPCVPSLFTFKMRDPRLEGLQGISFEKADIRMSVGDAKLEQSGPVLITHWGLSGPAVLKLSAWGARHLFISRYQADLIINWLPDFDSQTIHDEMKKQRELQPRKSIANSNIFHLPKRFWERLVECSGIDPSTTWSQVTRELLNTLADELTHGSYKVTGKGEFKEEFVTCGGVKLKEVDFNTMESKLCPGLYFAGEILDIDGITGGFNFQSAWSTGWIAGKSAAEG
jgi:hypothetical protein